MVKYQGHWNEEDERTKNGQMNPQWNQILNEEGDSILTVNGQFLHDKYSDGSCSDENLKLIHERKTELGIFIQDAINEKIKRDKN